MKHFIIPGVLLLFISTANLTAQWVQSSSGMGNVVAYQVISNGNYLFTGARNNPVGMGVYVSTNSGLNWTQTSLNNRDVWSLTVNENNIFAATWGYGVYISTNNGINWSQTTLGNGNDVSSLASNGSYVFAGTDFGGVYLSSNNGLNWQQSSLGNRWILSLAANANYVYTGISNSGLYLSPDNGFSWYLCPLNFPYIWTFALNGNDVFAATNQSGIYKSTNNGFDWYPTTLNNYIVHSIAIYGNSIIAGTFLNGIFVSNNYGLNWTQRNEGYPTGRIPKSLYVFNNYIFVGTDGSGVYRRLISELTGVSIISSEIPKSIYLYQNYPNPFNPTTHLRFEISELRFVKLPIYDVLGREVTTLVNQQLQPGTYEGEWDATNYPSGVYYYKLTSGDYTETKKMVLIK